MDVLEIPLTWLTDVKLVGVNSGGRREAVGYRFHRSEIGSSNQVQQQGPTFPDPFPPQTQLSSLLAPQVSKEPEAEERPVGLVHSQWVTFGSSETQNTYISVRRALSSLQCCPLRKVFTRQLLPVCTQEAAAETSELPREVV